MLALGDRGRQLLFDHGYDVGEGFVDVLSQYQSLEEAHRAGRLREVPRLLDALNAGEIVDPGSAVLSAAQRATIFDNWFYPEQAPEVGFG